MREKTWVLLALELGLSGAACCQHLKPKYAVLHMARHPSLGGMGLIINVNQPLVPPPDRLGKLLCILILKALLSLEL